MGACSGGHHSALRKFTVSIQLNPSLPFELPLAVLGGIIGGGGPEPGTNNSIEFGIKLLHALENLTTKSAPTQYSSIANNMQYITAHSCVPTYFFHLYHNCNLRKPLSLRTSSDPCPLTYETMILNAAHCCLKLVQTSISAEVPQVTSYKPHPLSYLQTPQSTNFSSTAP